MRKPTVLYITWAYRPTHTAGAIRAVNFVDALIESGLRVITLTVGHQESIERVSDGLTVYSVTENGQIPSEIDSSALPYWPGWKPIPGPDPVARSFRAVFRTAHGLIRQYEPGVLFATAPPFSSLVAGSQLAEQYNLPQILEFRDAWFTGMPWPYKNVIQRLGAKYWERRCVLSANRIITVTNAYRRILIDTYGPDVEKKTFTIRHGYDSRMQDDRQALPQIQPLSRQKNPFVITHTGQFQGFDVTSPQTFRRAWRSMRQGIARIVLGATSCNQLRLDWLCPYNLMAAVAKAAAENPQFRQKYRLIFAGQKFDQIDQWAQQMNLEHVHQFGPLPSPQARQIARQSDLLVLMLYGIKNCDYHWCVPSKIYDYLSTGKPVLALLPPGEAGDLVTQAGTAFPAPPEDISAIAQQLISLFKTQQSGGILRKPNWEFIKQFDLRLQQKQFAEVFLSVLGQSYRF